MKEIIDKIDYNFKTKFYYDYDTSKSVWFRTGGKAKVFCIVENEKELSIILQNLKDIPYEVIGAGSNILIRDSGYEGFLIKLGKNFNQIEIKKSNLTVGASILDINLSKFAQLNNIKNPKNLKFLLKEYFNDENIIVFMGAGSITNFAHELVS